MNFTVMRCYSYGGVLCTKAKPEWISRLSLCMVLLFILICSCTNAKESIEPTAPPTNPNTNESISDELKLTITSLTGPQAQSGTPITMAYDGDKKTFYHSAWSGISLPQELVARLKDDAARLDYIYLMPRADNGANGVILAGEVWVNTRTDATYQKLATFDFTGGLVGIIKLSKSVMNPLQVKVVITKTKGGGDNEVNKFISLSEFECYASNTKKDEFVAMFTDGSCTEVKPGITRASIEAVTDTVLRNIGLNVYDKKIDSRRIVECMTYPSPDVTARLNKTSTYGFVDNVTGIYVSPSSYTYIFVGGNPVAPLSARVIDHNANGLSFIDYPLQPGLNKFKPTSPGLIYIVYQSETPSTIKVFFARGFVNGYFDLKNTDSNTWSKIVGNAATSFMDLKGEYAVITFTVAALSGIPNSEIADYVKVWDEIVYKQQEFMGLVKYKRMHKTRMYVKGVPNGFMYAAGNYTAYNFDVLNALNSVEKLKTTGIWGPAHEIGHVNQLRPNFNWVGLGEVTNNVCSEYIQTYYNGLSGSRIQDEDLGNGLTRYQKAMNNAFTNEAFNHYTEADVFCKLVPFWQLQLYFSHVVGYTDFYKDFCEAMRNAPNGDDNLHHLEFYKLCCDITKTDLTDFFRAWGFLIPFTLRIEDYASRDITVTQNNIDAAILYVKNKGYTKPDTPMQYIQDNTVDLFKAKASYSNGTAQVTGNTVNLSGCRNAVVFIVKDKEGKVIKVYPPKDNSGTYSFETLTLPIGKVEAVDATGAFTIIYNAS